MTSKKIVDIQQSVKDDGQGKYFHIMLNMYDDDLDPYQYRLLGHYRRVCGAGGSCYEATSKTADICKMSIRKIKSTRKELQDLGCINIEPQKGSTLIITIADKMADNVNRYHKEVHEVHEGRASGAQGGVHEVHPKNNHIEEEPSKKIEEKESVAPVEPETTPAPPVVEENGWFDLYIIGDDVTTRIQTFRNQLKHAPALPDPRPKTKYKKSEAYLHLENIVKHVGEYRKAQGILLGQVLRWLWAEATSRDGKPATYADVLDYWQWIHGQGISMKDPAKIKGDTPSDYSWDKWKSAHPTVMALVKEEPKPVPVIQQILADYDAAQARKRGA